MTYAVTSSVIAALTTIAILAGGSPACVDRAIREYAKEADTLGTPTLAVTLAQAGYTAIPIRWENGTPIVHATIGILPVEMRLDSGSPFDLWLDASLAFEAQPGVHPTNVLSGYWTFTPARGSWATVDQLTVGGAMLHALEAKIELGSLPEMHAVLGATALMSQGAIIDYATDTLYLLTGHAQQQSTEQAAALPSSGPATLRAALTHAGHYGTFLTLMQQAGMLSLLDSLPTHATSNATPRAVSSDSIAWLGLRIRAEQVSGVGVMAPNEMHLQLTRQAVDHEIRGSRQYTVFVPTDAAFARLPAVTLHALRTDTVRLARLLRAHLYSGAAIDTSTMRTLLRGAAHTGPNGPAFGWYVRGTQIDVDRLASWTEGRVVARASIVQPDIKAAHGVAVAHGIDRVLDQSGELSPLDAALRRDGYVGIPLHRREDGNGYFVQATVNGVPVQLTIATGTRGDIMLDHQWSTRLLPSHSHDYVVAFDAVKLGPVRIETADLSPSLRAAKSQGYRTTEGLVGSALLAKYRARVDYEAGMVYLRVPVASPTRSDH